MTQKLAIRSGGAGDTAGGGVVSVGPARCSPAVASFSRSSSRASSLYHSESVLLPRTCLRARRVARLEGPQPSSRTWSSITFLSRFSICDFA